MKIIHFADTHIEERTHDEVLRCIEYLVETVEEIRPTAIIFSGDATNSKYLGADTNSAKTLMWMFRRLSDVAPVAVVCGTDSHDGNIPELLRNVNGRCPIHVSDTAEQIYLIYEFGRELFWETLDSVTVKREDTKLVVSQVPPPSKEHWKNRQGVEEDNQNIAEAMGAIFTGFAVNAKSFPNAPHILNGHFSVSGSKISENQLLPGGDIAISTDVLSMAQCDLICLGHIHMAQRIDILMSGPAFYSGSIYRKDFGERKEDKGFWLHNFDMNVKTSVKLSEQYESSEFIKTPTREMVLADFDCINQYDLSIDTGIPITFSDEILQTVSEFKKIKGLYIKVRITLWIDEIRLINQSEIKRTLYDAGAANVELEIERVRRENSRDEKVLKSDILRDKIQALADLRSTPAPDGVFDMADKVETLNTDDLIKYSKERING